MNKKYIYRYLVLLLIISIILSACSDDKILTTNSQPNEDNSYADLIFNDKIEIHNYPSFGSLQTDFKFSVKLNDPTVQVSKVHYDFTYNNEYDTTASSWDTVKTKFDSFGYNTVIATVHLKDNSTISCSTVVWVTEPIEIFSDGNVFYEPNLYNGHTISVTHGSYHRVQFIDLFTFEIDKCYFCNFSTSNFDEMHVSILSFDGNKLIFDNGINYDFCYYDLEKSDSTVIDLPIKIPSYPIGQITWSLDDRSVYYISVDNNYNENGVSAYNIDSNKFTKLYDNGNYICVLPDEQNKLAILERVTDSTSNLIILNTNTKIAEEEYLDIPFNKPFRMLKGNDRIYIDGELAFYSLLRNETYYMDFGEMDLTQHAIGEADINMDGNRFIIGTWKGVRSLYYVSLPNNF